MILGVDVHAQSSFAYVVFDDSKGSTVEKGYGNDAQISLVIKRYRPRLIAIDSVSELLEWGRRIIRTIGNAPIHIDVVQVTTIDGVYEASVENLVRKYLGVSVGKLDPMSTAYYLAVLASMGIGSIVKFYESETHIVIGKAVATRQGGMSRNRYERNVAHRVKQIVRDVVHALSTAGIDYDVFYRDNGLSALIVAYADRPTVIRTVKQRRSLDVKVKVFSVPSRDIRIVGRVGESQQVVQPRSTRPLIVGVDPGIVTGLAVLDLRGNILYVGSHRGLSRSKAVEIVSRYGSPLIVAVDVNPPPEYARKLAAMVGAQLYFPSRDLGVDEKIGIIGDRIAAANNSHERDALAAAYKAFHEYKPKFDKIEKEASNVVPRDKIDLIKAMVVKGRSIVEAIAMVLNERGEADRTKVIYVHQESRRECNVDGYKAYIYALENELDTVKREKKELEEAVRRLEDETYRQFRRDMRVRELEYRVSNLLQELEKSRLAAEDMIGKFREVLMGIYEGRYMVRIMNSPTTDLPLMDRESVSSAEADVAISDIRDLNVSRDLLRRLGKVVVPLGEVYVYNIGDVYVLDRDRVRKIVEELSRDKYLDRNTLRRLVDEYRRTRIG